MVLATEIKNEDIKEQNKKEKESKEVKDIVEVLKDERVGRTHKLKEILKIDCKNTT